MVNKRNRDRLMTALRVMREETCATSDQQDAFFNRILANTVSLDAMSEDKLNEWVAKEARVIALPSQASELEQLLLKHKFLDPPKPKNRWLHVSLAIEVEDADNVSIGDLCSAVRGVGSITGQKVTDVLWHDQATADRYSSTPPDGRDFHFKKATARR